MENLNDIVVDLKNLACDLNQINKDLQITCCIIKEFDFDKQTKSLSYAGNMTGKDAKDYLEAVTKSLLTISIKLEKILGITEEDLY